MYDKRLRINRAVTIVPNNDGGMAAVNTASGDAFLIASPVFAVLEAFSQPTLVSVVIKALMRPNGYSEDELMGHIRKMYEHKFLVEESHRGLAAQERHYFGAYQHISNQKEMLMDSARTNAFMAAIAESVGPHDVVIDVGSGTGILALFAAREGARKVFAIERSKIIVIAEEIAKRNGYSNQISFMQCMAEEFQCKEQASVIVSEWLGDFVLRELMFKSFCSVRDRYAGPDIKCIPSRVRMYIAPIEDAAIWRKNGPGYWLSPVYGFNFATAFDIEQEKLGSTRVSIPEAAYLSERAIVNDIDCANATIDEFYFSSGVEFVISRNGALHGFSGSFDMQLSPTVWLDTGSHAKSTHWEQVFFPLLDALPVKMGDHIVLQLKMQEPGNPQKRVPDTFLDMKVYRGPELIHSFSSWYDKARGGMF